MVTFKHEMMHRVFRDHPEALSSTMRTLGFDFPETVATSVFDTDLTEFKPVERRPDTVLHVQDKEGEAFLVVVESQSRPEPSKRRSWPYYVAYLHEYRKLPVVLIVICQDLRTSAWAQETIHIGTRFHTSASVQPIVLGPHNIPLPGPRIAPEDAPLAVLATIVHARDPSVVQTLSALATALDDTDEETRADLALAVELALANLPAGLTWRKLMSFNLDELRRSPALQKILDDNDATQRVVGKAEGLTEGRAEGHTEGRAEGHTEGRAEGLAEAFMRLLNARGLHPTTQQRQRISGCTNMATLCAWFDKAVGADTLDGLFDDAPDECSGLGEIGDQTGTPETPLPSR